jgi:hypothetical protein
MKTTTQNPIRRTLISLATAAVIAMPGLATAGLGDRIQAVKTKANVHITNVRENRPVLQAVENARPQAAEIFQQVQELQVIEQFQDTLLLLQEIQSDYRYFSGGQGCNASCASFRASLRNIFNDFASLVDEVPALSDNQELVANIQRIANLIDYIPPRALYLMWQAMSAKVEELAYMASEIRETLAYLPPLMPAASLGVTTRSTASRGALRTNASDRTCDWVDDEKKPVIELIQGRLEMFGWQMEKVADLIPDAEVKGSAGATAGAAVANGLASAGASVKPTDAPKIGLKVLGIIPQQLSWTIKINMLRAKVLCS